jgi:hypothetical protein
MKPGDTIKVKQNCNTVALRGLLGTIVKRERSGAAGARVAYQCQLEGRQSTVLMWKDELETT